MSTRGLFGFRIDGIDKLSYQHYDSYPRGLGKEVIDNYKKLIANFGSYQAKELAKKLRIVTLDDVPTEDEKIQFDLKSDSWNDLLERNRIRDMNLYSMFFSGVIADDSRFICDSLFCEWAYIINFDDNVMEVYKGFQKLPHNNGRFVGKESQRHDYYPCALIATFPLNNLPTKEEFEVTCCRCCEKKNE